MSDPHSPRPHIPPAGTEYDPRMGVPHVIGGTEHDGHPGETCADALFVRAIRSAGTPPASRETLDDLRESHRHIRRAGFPEHRPDVECYCDTCWGYLADEAGGDPERRANDAS